MSITSDELNYLVYRYLQESGFVHSAFVFAYESLVGRTELASTDIPPGALINFLQKGLQYVEIEKELDRKGGEDIANGVSLLAGAMDTSEDGPAAGDAADGSKTTLDLAGRMRARPQSDVAVTSGDVTQLKGHDGEVLICSWSPKADVLASGSGDSTVRLWTVPRGASGLPAGTTASSSAKVLAHSQQGASAKDITTLDWKPDGQKLATGCYDGKARIWSAQGVLEHTLSSHKGTLFSMKWSRSGSYLLSGGLDKTAVVWDAASGTIMQQYELHSEPILDVDWRDDESFATCSVDKLIYHCKVDSREPVQKYEGHKNEVNCVKWNDEGSLLASCSDDATAKIWKPDAPACVHDLTAHSQQVYQIRWAPTGAGTANRHLVATASFDKTVRTWDAETGQSLHTLAGHAESVYSVAFSPDGQFLASGSMDNTMRIWSVKDGKCVKSYKGSGGVYEVSWNKDGDKVAACFGVPSKSVCVIDFRK